ncbi:hypothetical protein F1C76_20345 [Geodermatophilaceae bacterium NBWT11]|nr:hypothetical protein F1C76_20345 [Geodermatophilaceae bacterium NBWT11]
MRYEFRVVGAVSAALGAAFPELTARAGLAAGTTFFGPVLDSAQLHGLLDRFHALGLTVVELRQLPD